MSAGSSFPDFAPMHREAARYYNEKAAAYRSWHPHCRGGEERQRLHVTLTAGQVTSGTAVPSPGNVRLTPQASRL